MRWVWALAAGGAALMAAGAASACDGGGCRGMGPVYDYAAPQGGYDGAGDVRDADVPPQAFSSGGYGDYDRYGGGGGSDDQDQYADQGQTQYASQAQYDRQNQYADEAGYSGQNVNHCGSCTSGGYARTGARYGAVSVETQDYDSGWRTVRRSSSETYGDDCLRYDSYGRRTYCETGPTYLSPGFFQSSGGVGPEVYYTSGGRTVVYSTARSTAYASAYASASASVRISGGFHGGGRGGCGCH